MGAAPRKTVTKRTTKTVVRQRDLPPTTVNINVFGAVTWCADRSAAAGLRIAAFYRHARGDVRVGGAISDGLGRYEIRFVLGGPALETRPDLVVTVAAANEATLLLRTDPISTRELAIHLDLVVRHPGEVDAPELTRLETALAPHLRGRALQDLSAEDAAALAARIGESADRVNEIADAARASTALEIPLELSYALIRERLPFDLAELGRLSDSVVRKAVAGAVDSKVIPPTSTDAVDVLITRTKFRASDRQPITDLAGGHELPPAVAASLRKRKIATLDELRAAGGLDQFDELHELRDHPAVARIDGHARLSALTANADERNALLDAGLSGISAIARMDPERLNRVLDGRLDRPAAARLLQTARTQEHVAKNVVIDLRVQLLTGATPTLGSVPIRLIPMLTSACECRDCESAVSPLAYLADLMAYLKDNVRDTATAAVAIDWRFLEQHFRQPFGRLPVTCGAVEELVSKIRICVEVMRRQLAATPLTAAQQTVLASAERDYVRSAYEMLLVRIGTSLEELRLIRRADDAIRREAAERIGVSAPSAGTDRLADLLLDTEGAPLADLEQQIEEIFGLANSRTDPLQARATPRLVQWRRDRLREIWRDQDWPADLPVTIAIVDPDVIGPDDFRDPSASPVFALWAKRREWVDAELQALGGLTIEQMVASMSQPHSYPLDAGAVSRQWPAQPNDLESLYDRAGSGSTDQSALAQIRDRLLVYGLSLEALNRLVELTRKAAAAAADPRLPRIDETEATDVRSILVQALKQLLLDRWREEETSRNVEFGPNQFWISVREPAEGEWPPAVRPGIPLIDPELLRPSDLPDSGVAVQARALYAARQTEIGQLRDALKAARENPAQGFASMVGIALGAPLGVDLDQTFTDLMSSDAATALQAETVVTSGLFLTVDQFRTFMNVRAKDGEADPLKKPSASEYDEIYRLLVGAQKRRQTYAVWSQAEQAAGITYWEARKAALPPWRSRADARIDWQRALRVRMSPTLIDPDLITRGHLKPPGAANPALAIWNLRSSSIAAFRATLDAAPKTAVGFDGIVQSTLGIAVNDLQEIAAAGQRGEAIGKRLDQLGLSFTAFNRLVKVAALLDANQTVLTHEWRDAFDILTQVWKGRNGVQWRRDERAIPLTLSPDYFQVPPPDPLTFPPPPRPQPIAFRASNDALLEWEGALESRQQTDLAIQDAVTQIVAVVEEATLPALRDALVAAPPVPPAAATDRAKYFSGLLMIDMKSGGCSTTTRVAQAIETVQGLLFVIRSGQHLAIDSLRTLAFTATAATTFDADWQWMGSYSTWRAAMFVFLYPENIALPSLRRHATPVFGDLVRQLRSVGRISPADAVEAARTYQTYFEDVCALELGWATRAAIGPDTQPETLIFLFARSPKSDKTFWSTRAASGDASTQTFWREVPGLGATQSIIGAAAYTMSPATRFLYLFVTTTEVARPKLVFVQFDLVKQTWTSGEPTELELPAERAFPTVVQVLAGSPPAFYFQFADGTDATRSLSANGNGWQGNDFTPVTVTETLVQWEDGSRSSEGLGNESLWQSRPPSWTRILKWMKAANEHAKNAGGDFVAGFPTFEEDADRFGVVMLTSRLAEVWSIQRLLNQAPPEVDTNFGLGAIAANAHTLAGTQGFASGLPIFTEESGIWTWTEVALIRSMPEVTSMYFSFGSYLENALAVPTRAPRAIFQAGFDGSDFAARFAMAQRYRPSVNHLGFPTFSEAAPFAFDRPCHFPLTRIVRTNVPTALLPEPISGPFKPAFAGPFDANVVDTRDRQALRARSAAAYQNNTQVPASFLTYFDEAWHFGPVHLALQLQRSGHYQQALDWFRLVYDDTAPITARRIFYGLTRERSQSIAFTREADWGWLRNDPLDPHRIAETRRDIYTRFTLLALARCLLDFGDAEFTRDTSESVPRARLLYEAALALLDDPALLQKYAGACTETIGMLEIQFGDAYLEMLDDVGRNWGRRFDEATVARMVTGVSAILNGGGSTEERSTRFKTLLARETEAHEAAEAGTMQVLLEREEARTAALYDAVLMLPGAAMRAQESVTELIVNQRHVPAAMITACVPVNPIPRALKLRAEANLHKIRTCRNIAGVKRDLEAYAAATDTMTGMPSIGGAGQLVVPGLDAPRPTPYRYTALIERTKQMVQFAQQAENAMFSALQLRDSEAYSLLKARQDVQHSRAAVTLQDLRVTESEDEEVLAQLQRDRADIQVKTYEAWIDRGLLDQEEGMIAGYYLTAGKQAIAASNGALLSQLSTPTAAVPYIGAVVTAAIWVKAAAESQVALGQAITSHLAILANFERKKQEWELSRDLARQDIAIGNQQIRVAQDRTRITRQERVIAQLDADNAERTVDFLSTKFTNVELYDWMAGVLEGVYRYFLQQATAMAQLAASQLGFERQEPPPPFIQADYWEAPSDEAFASTGTARALDRRGLTGSARLLQDVVQLDQYAFETNRR
jgi:hypothetical protein